jgi:hypothetical protein
MLCRWRAVLSTVRAGGLSTPPTPNRSDDETAGTQSARAGLNKFALPALGSLPLATTTTEGRTVTFQAYSDKAYPRSRARSTSNDSHRDASIVLRLDGVATRSAEG